MIFLLYAFWSFIYNLCFLDLSVSSAGSGYRIRLQLGGGDSHIKRGVDARHTSRIRLR